MHRLRLLLASALLPALGACTAGPAGSAAAPGAAGADAAPVSTELKVTIREDQIAAARTALGLDDAGAEHLQIAFYDTRALELYAAGLILRSRTVQGGGDDVTVKLRPLPCAEVAARWFEIEGFKCEEDRTGTTGTPSCSYTVDRSARAIAEAGSGQRNIESLFSDDQRAFLQAYAKVAPDWAALKVLGPIPSREWELRLPGVTSEVSAELWTLPDGRELLELSTAVPKAAADAAATALDAALRARGLTPATAQETKTHIALECFAAR